MFLSKQKNRDDVVLRGFIFVLRKRVGHKDIATRLTVIAMSRLVVVVVFVVFVILFVSAYLYFF